MLMFKWEGGKKNYENKKQICFTKVTYNVFFLFTESDTACKANIEESSWDVPTSSLLALPTSFPVSCK